MNDISHPPEAQTRCHRRKHVRVLSGLLVFCCLYYSLNLTEKSSMQKPSTQITSSNQPTALRPKPSRKFILQPLNEFTPEVCWLMSFPNSGTSFTMTMVARASNKSFASNYADEVTANDQPDSLSIYPRRPEGPYWAGLSGKIASPRPRKCIYPERGRIAISVFDLRVFALPLLVPEKYVLTKTHCGSRCVQCGPVDYVETPTIFLRKCASGHARIGPHRHRVDVEYPPSRVHRAIHLIRNPLHNIIARFHLDHRHRARSNKTEWLATHPNNAEGLQAWCRDLDTDYRKQDETFFGKETVPTVICHGEFFKYTQWHNLVHEGLNLINHTVPVLLVYYEDYSLKFNETVKIILDFMDLEHVGILRDFQARSDYKSYFTDKQQVEIGNLIQDVASEKTWMQVKHYFE
jgi:hypothetical protein